MGPTRHGRCWKVQGSLLEHKRIKVYVSCLNKDSNPMTKDVLGSPYVIRSVRSLHNLINIQRLQSYINEHFL